MPEKTSLPDWELVLSAAARLQPLLPDAVLVGGTASAIHAQPRFSRDADHVLPRLREHFDEVLAQLESVAGWKTARVQRPVQILGSLDGIETGIRQLIREQPLETMVVNYGSQAITVPTKEEILRIKGALILKRNATRDYLDFVALADHLGAERTALALSDFDRLYPQANDESALQQLQIQLSNPLPYDLEQTRLNEYKNLAQKWHDWNTVKAVCQRCATTVFDRVAALEQKRVQKEPKGPE
ncbi:MAG: nucleotidyl transferase AbiEii/AbiGii toxin family protein [Limisphaerales bacterium]